MNNLSTQPYKGARDFYPEEMRVRNYIFETWKKVCKSYGFEEYDFPILEPFEIFASKTGEEIVNEQLYSFEDKGGRKLAIRPEITPGTVRMIAQKYKELPRPIKWFMIGNNWRFEKPQLGRGREFYQLEVNVFGEQSVTADFEIFSIITDVMKAFGADETMYSLLVSDRRLITALLMDTLGLNEDLQIKARRLMDKRKKMSKNEFIESLKEIGLTLEQATQVDNFMGASFNTLNSIIPDQILQKNAGYLTLVALFGLCEKTGLGKFIKFDPSIIRGFDYSDGIVYEVFDKNPANARSIFGGERFDRLIEIFGQDQLPATGFAMGDYTLVEFLKNWNLLPKLESSLEYFVTIWASNNTTQQNLYFETAAKIAQKIRSKGKNCLLWLEPGAKLDKQLKYADKKNAQYVIIVGDEELKNGTVTIKDMLNKSQEVKPLRDFLE